VYSADFTHKFVSPGENELYIELCVKKEQLFASADFIYKFIPQGKM